jgi:dsRNA-specific ribonuclease
MGPADDVTMDDENHASSPPSLKIWWRVLRDVPLARILPRDSDFGAGVGDERRSGETAERLAFFGDKMLNAAVASALYDLHGLSLSTGDMSTLAARARSNRMFANLLPALLREDMVAATPQDAVLLGRSHSAGTMVEAAVFLVRTEFGGADADAAIAEVGAFLLHSATAGGTHVSDVVNHKGTLLELVQKGVPGTLRSEGVGPEGIDQEFEAVAELDGASAKAKARTKRGAEQKAARCVFHALVQGNGRAHGGVWTGTPDAPVAPQQAYE